MIVELSSDEIALKREERTKVAEINLREDKILLAANNIRLALSILDGVIEERMSNDSRTKF